MKIMETYIPYPIPDHPLRDELITAGQIASSIGPRTNRSGPEYRAAHARVVKAIAALFNRFGFEEDDRTGSHPECKADEALGREPSAKLQG